ncbi:MAG: NADH-quinone oxidoreductase subunit L, partial [Mariprofundus sp.]|nr:NADH-quinone oxidoreductase subunit L [Mariprofundus sp.]
LRKYMPITYITMLLAALALSGIPPFAGFFSKDLIIEATMIREFNEYSWVTTLATFALMSGVLMTAFYTFRMFFLTFHNSDRVEPEVKAHLHESPKTITIPLMILAVGAVFAGMVGNYIGMGEHADFFGDSIFVLEKHDPLLMLQREDTDHVYSHFLLEYGALTLAILGIALATFMYFRETAMPAAIAKAAGPIYTFLLNKWYWDEFYDKVFVAPARCLGNFLWQKGDLGMIDKGMIHGGIVDTIKSGAARMRAMQTGMIFHYAFAMVIGAFGLLTYLLLTA